MPARRYFVVNPPNNLAISYFRDHGITIGSVQMEYLRRGTASGYVFLQRACRVCGSDALGWCGSWPLEALQECDEFGNIIPEMTCSHICRPYCICMTEREHA